MEQAIQAIELDRSDDEQDEKIELIGKKVKRKRKHQDSSAEVAQLKEKIAELEKKVKEVEEIFTCPYCCRHMSIPLVHSKCQNMICVDCWLILPRDYQCPICRDDEGNTHMDWYVDEFLATHFQRQGNTVENKKLAKDQFWRTCVAKQIVNTRRLYKFHVTYKIPAKIDSSSQVHEFISDNVPLFFSRLYSHLKFSLKEKQVNAESLYKNLKNHTRDIPFFIDAGEISFNDLKERPNQIVLAFTDQDEYLAHPEKCYAVVVTIVF